MRAERTPGNGGVVADGDRTRYPGGAYECTWNERALCVNLGGTAGWFQVLSQIWGRAFFDSPDRSGKGVWRYETQYQTMARPVLQYQFPERTPFKYSVSKIGESIMMNLLKKLAACGLSLTMILSLAACGGTDDTSSGESGCEPVKYLIGISQYGQHGSLDNCREGFLQGLEQAGLVEGTDFEVDYQNANFDDNQATQIGQMFSAEDADLMVGIDTNSAIACFNAAEDKDIPVIFTAITDPVGAHLDAGNITGTSDALPVEGQLQLIRALQPDADTIGIVYTTSEANSVYSISVYEELATDYGFTIDAVGVTSQAEVTQAVDTLLSHGVDCLSNLTDNNVVGVLGAILENTDEAGIPVYGSEVEQVKLG